MSCIAIVRSLAFTCWNMFDEFQTAHVPTKRRPVMDTLYDVYVGIRGSE